MLSQDLNFITYYTRAINHISLIIFDHVTYNFNLIKNIN